MPQCIKNPGKSWKPWEKLQCSWPVPIVFNPSFECFAVFEIFAGQPLVVFRSETDPSDKILVPTTTFPCVKNVFNDAFFHPFSSQDRARLWQFAIGKQSCIVFVIGFEFRGVVWIGIVVVQSIRWGFRVWLGDCVWAIPMREEFSSMAISFLFVFSSPVEGT